MSMPIIGGIPNYLANPRWKTGTSSFESVDNPLANIKTPEPSEVSRLTTTDPRKTRWRFINWASGGHELAGFFAAGHNFRGTGQYRIVGSVADGLEEMLGFERLLPTGLVDSTNTTGVYTSVDDEPATPGADYMVPTSQNAAWMARFSFDLPLAPPLVGSDLQAFVVYVERVAGTDAFNPEIVARLYEGGVFRSTIATKYVSETGGQILIFPWNASLLNTPSGANVEVQLDLGSTPGASYIKLGAVAWDSDTSTADFDSGWISIPEELNSSLLGDSFPTGPSPSRSFSYVPATPWPGDGLGPVIDVNLMVRAGHHVGDAYEDSDTVDSFAEIGVFSGGPVLTITNGIPLDSGGPHIKVITESRGGRTGGGQSYGADAFRYRELSAEFLVTRDERDLILDRIAWRKGTASPFWVALEPGVSPERQQFTSAWVNLKSMGEPRPVSAYSPGGDMLYRMQMTFVERL